MMEISEKRLQELEMAESKLDALEAGGVDNWAGYDDSLAEYRKENELTEDRLSLLDELESVFGECAYEPSERGAGIAFRDSARTEAMKVLFDNGVYFKKEED